MTDAELHALNQQLREVTSDYIDVRGDDGRVVLDGEFHVDELEKIVALVRSALAQEVRPMTPTTEELKRLRELALAATQGPWERYDHKVREMRGPLCICIPNLEKDEQFIAASNPATILQLLDLIESQQAELSRRDLLLAIRPGVNS